MKIDKLGKQLALIAGHVLIIFSAAAKITPNNQPINATLMFPVFLIFGMIFLGMAVFAEDA